MDAESLAQWIEISPATEAWISGRLGKPLVGVNSIESEWQRWSGSANPALPHSIFAEVLESGFSSLQAWIEMPPSKPYIVAVDRREEALAFIASALQESGLAKYADQTVVIHSKDALSKICLQPPRLVIAANRDVERGLGGLPGKTHVIVAVSKNDFREEVDLQLEPISPYHFQNVAEEMGIPEEQRSRLARESGKSITVGYKTGTLITAESTTRQKRGYTHVAQV